MSDVQRVNDGTWYTIVCRECNPDPEDMLIMPFETAQARGEWAAAHTKGSGHDRWLVLDQPRDL